jgi:hypothetical protein
MKIPYKSPNDILQNNLPNHLGIDHRGLMIYIFIDSNDPKTFLLILMLLPILLFIKLKQVIMTTKEFTFTIGGKQKRMN